MRDALEKMGVVTYSFCALLDEGSLTKQRCAGRHSRGDISRGKIVAEGLRTIKISTDRGR